MSELFLVSDLSGTQFHETGDTTKPARSWVHATPLNKTFTHPTYGQIEFGEERSRRMVDSVNGRVRGVTADIDYDHKHGSRMDAAGWAEAAELREDGVWLDVVWTADGHEAVKSGRYRYFSPEIHPLWKDPRTGDAHRDVLAGGALTNRPFLGGNLVPITLADGGVGIRGVELHTATPTEGGAHMPEPKAPEQPGLVPPAPAPTPAPVPEVAQLNDQVVQLQEQNEKLLKALALGEAERRKTALAQRFSAIVDGAKFALPTTLSEKLPALLAELQPKHADTLLSLMEDIAAAPEIQLGENTEVKTPPSTENTASAADQLEARVQAYMEKHPGVGYTDAALALARTTEGDMLLAAYETEVTV